jgi:hypothetical protein
MRAGYRRDAERNGSTRQRHLQERADSADGLQRYLFNTRTTSDQTRSGVGQPPASLRKGPVQERRGELLVLRDLVGHLCPGLAGDVTAQLSPRPKYSSWVAMQTS